MHGVDARRRPELDHLLERMTRVEVGDVAREEASRLAPLARHEPTNGREPKARVNRPQRVPGRRRRHRELERRDAPPGRYHARKLAQRRTWIVDVAQQVGEREVIELAVTERERLRLAPYERDEMLERRVPRESGAGGREHLGALVEPDDGAPIAARKRPRNKSRTGRHIQHALSWPGVNGRDHRPPPARILAEAQK